MNTRSVNTRLFGLCVLVCQLCALTLSGQGFIRSYPFNTQFRGGGQSLYPQADGSFRMTALSFPDFGVDIQLTWLETDVLGNLVQADTLTEPDINSPVYGNDIFLLENGGYLRAFVDSNELTLKRFNAAGDELWSTMHAFPSIQRCSLINVHANPAGAVFVRGYTWQSGGGSADDQGFLLKFSADGDLLWDRLYAFDLTYVIPSSFLTTPDGGCLFSNWGMMDTVSFSSEYLVRYDAAGNQLWHFSPYNGRLWPGFSGQQFDRNAADQTYAFTYKHNNPSSPATFRLDKLNNNGALIDSLDLDDLLGLVNPAGKLVLATADGGAVVVAEQSVTNSHTYRMARFDAGGSLVWQRPLGFFTDAFPAEFHRGLELPDGSMAFYAFQGDRLFLIKMDSDGRIYPHTLTGAVVRDSTFNCLADAFDPPLNGWVVSATGNGFTLFASSDSSGHYTIPDLDTIPYQVVLTPPNYLWEPCLDTVQWQNTNTLPSLDTLDFPVQAVYDCPVMYVDMATPFLRRCMTNTYAIQYCNSGNQPAPDAFVTVELDPLLVPDSASLPFTQNGSLLTFPLGDVGAGECGTIQLYTTTSCDAQLGQTLCTEARIYPDTLCAPNLPNWSGAWVQVSAECAGDSVLFRIQNTGQAPMPQALDFIIVDDHVITRQGSFQLPAGGVQEEVVTADGSTWRLIAEQEPGFPYGPEMPTVGVEACVALPGSTFSMGMLNMFPNYSGNPFQDNDCRTVIGSFDPNDKQALPVGVDDDHLIEPNQPIDYLIRFQNTGTDTAFKVVIRDTLSPLLDPASIQPGASSHAYTWRLSGSGILTVTFDNILLPDSNVNEPASHGFVQFRIRQKKDNPLGLVIENSAGIYFDFNDPVITNTVFHTIGKNFLTSIGPNPAAPEQLAIWPNPAVERAIVRLDDYRGSEYRLNLYNSVGRLVSVRPAGHLYQPVLRDGLPAGLYWVELRNQQRVIAVGKLVFVD